MLEVPLQAADPTGVSALEAGLTDDEDAGFSIPVGDTVPPVKIASATRRANALRTSPARPVATARGCTIGLAVAPIEESDPDPDSGIKIPTVPAEAAAAAAAVRVPLAPLSDERGDGRTTSRDSRDPCRECRSSPTRRLLPLPRDESLCTSPSDVDPTSLPDPVVASDTVAVVPAPVAGPLNSPPHTPPADPDCRRRCFDDDDAIATTSRDRSPASARARPEGAAPCPSDAADPCDCDEPRDDALDARDPADPLDGPSSPKPPHARCCTPRAPLDPIDARDSRRWQSSLPLLPPTPLLPWPADPTDASELCALTRWLHTLAASPAVPSFRGSDRVRGCGCAAAAAGAGIVAAPPKLARRPREAATADPAAAVAAPSTLVVEATVVEVLPCAVAVADARPSVLVADARSTSLAVGVRPSALIVDSVFSATSSAAAVVVVVVVVVGIRPSFVAVVDDRLSALVVDARSSALAVDARPSALVATSLYSATATATATAVVAFVVVVDVVGIRPSFVAVIDDRPSAVAAGPTLPPTPSASRLVSLARLCSAAPFSAVRRRTRPSSAPRQLPTSVASPFVSFALAEEASRRPNDVTVCTASLARRDPRPADAEAAAPAANASLARRGARLAVSKAVAAAAGAGTTESSSGTTASDTTVAATARL
ncbi:hypothetical protein HK405_007817, partial [Cladochytrium tenue]